MEVPMILLLLNFIIVSALSAAPRSTGFHIHSLLGASVLHWINLRSSELSSHGTTIPNQRFLQDAPKHNAGRHSEKAFPPSNSPFKHLTRESVHEPASSPSLPFYKHHHAKHKRPSTQLPLPTYGPQGVAPFFSQSHSPFPSTSWGSPAHAPSPTSPSSQYRIPIPPNALSPSRSSFKKKAAQPPSPLLTHLPPPPNEDCTSVTCTEPLTCSPPGSPCGCVWPIEVRLRLNVPLYTFFPLVSELAKEIADSLSLNQSQVRILGANAASQQLEKTIVLFQLLPSKGSFNKSTAFFVYKKFWLKQVLIKTLLLGAYEVIYVHYPGLPPSPPHVTASAATIDDQPYPGNNNGGTAIKPLGVDVPRSKKNGSSKSMIAVIVLSSIMAFVVCIGVGWLFLLKYSCIHQSEQTAHVLTSSREKQSGAAGTLTIGSRPSSSLSLSSLAYTGTAKIFSLSDMERATSNFDDLRILGEGGFGLVYSGDLDDGRKVAVKVLKRDNQQGNREFLAEVEMLNRLHHRNLVKLIGICSEDHTRCLVYELVPNGSLESHLHGIDKEADPLDWGARMKIALGAARGLAYLHEDSSPCVIHRDFKSSNILLENDFTPKVSDFGLARTAMDSGNKHISTHVMGTFGYLAPEYAMTGHLLVKSDVYSYGVVLLELLTGRKPVDLSQPPGQENLVAWARPLLTYEEGLEMIIDPVLKPTIPRDSAFKVGAIASMCVQPEVSHRPFMGEVVQALKLVCDEFDETREPVSRSWSTDDLTADVDSFDNTRPQIIGASAELMEASGTCYLVKGYDSMFDPKIAVSSDLGGLEGAEFGSFRRDFNSAPLRMGRGRGFWQSLRGLSRGSMSERGFSLKMFSGSH